MQELNDMLDMDHVTIKMIENAVIILKEEDQLIRLYFYVDDSETLQQIPQVLFRFKQKPIIADIIERVKQREKLRDQLQKYSFHKHSTLIRMRSQALENRNKKLSNVTLAKEDRVNEIMELLHSEFDVYISHLPDKAKLLRAIQNSEITLVIEQNQIAGLAYFERLGEKLIYLYQLVVDKRFRGQGIADILLMHQFNQLPNDVVCQLWVESNNFSAINKYEKYHFAPDGLVDSIMMFRGEDNGKNL
jgi:ribosomal protein S18 acetylase RimI-like enzyme